MLFSRMARVNFRRSSASDSLMKKICALVAPKHCQYLDSSFPPEGHCCCFEITPESPSGKSPELHPMRLDLICNFQLSPEIRGLHLIQQVAVPCLLPPIPLLFTPQKLWSVCAFVSNSLGPVNQSSILEKNCPSRPTGRGYISVTWNDKIVGCQ